MTVPTRAPAHRFTAQLVVNAVVFAVVLSGGACSAPEPPPAAAAGPDLSPLTIAPLANDPKTADVVWRYLDPASGEVRSALTIDEIPEHARRQVVVFDPRRDPPAGYDFVADVGQGLPATAHPVANFAFPTRAAMAPVERPRTPTQTSNSAAREVILFSTQGCGYCKKARKYLTANKIPFTELDVEEDPSASQKLQSLGQRAGLGARDLQGVPILFVDGKPMVGWDERQAAKLLGLSG